MIALAGLVVETFAHCQIARVDTLLFIVLAIEIATGDGSAAVDTFAPVSVDSIGVAFPLCLRHCVAWLAVVTRI